MGGGTAINNAVYGSFAGMAVNIATTIILNFKPSCLFIYDNNTVIDIWIFTDGKSKIGIRTSDNSSIKDYVDVEFTDNGFIYTQKLTNLTRTVRYMAIY